MGVALARAETVEAAAPDAKSAALPGHRSPFATAVTLLTIAGSQGNPAKPFDGKNAWATLADRYPADLDAAAFSALYHLAPARFVGVGRVSQRHLEKLGLLPKLPWQEFVGVRDFSAGKPSTSTSSSRLRTARPSGQPAPSSPPAR